MQSRAFCKELEVLIVLELKKLESIIQSQGLLPLFLVRDELSLESIQQCHMASIISMSKKVISFLWSHWFTHSEGQAKVCHVLPCTETCAITELLLFKTWDSGTTCSEVTCREGFSDLKCVSRQKREVALMSVCGTVIHAGGTDTGLTVGLLV